MTGMEETMMAEIPGPRPLPLHLALTTMLSMSSIAALNNLRNGSLPWKPELAEKGRDLAEAFAPFDPDLVASSVQAELTQRIGLFADGVRLYRQAPRHRVDAGECVQSLGTTRLLDYGIGPASKAPPVLVIPSLVNRYYVLDLEQDNSFLRQLAAQGYHPYVIDWDSPGEEEKDFGLSAYITDRLEPLLDYVSERHDNSPVCLLGYCMGGLLAAALAERLPDRTSSLILLATPWDFHTGHEAQIRMLEAMMPQFDTLIEIMGVMPVDVLQAMFVSLDPWLTLDKFQRFARMTPDSANAKSFVSLEDWLNDGIPLSGPAARDCLQGWYIENRPQNGNWLVGGRPVTPGRINTPSLSFIPGRDHIVPPASATALADALPDSETLRVDTGHIGMVVGRRSKDLLIDPMVAWLEKIMKN